MCKRTKDEIAELLKELPETPSGLISMLKPGIFHGVVEWSVAEGRMLSFPIPEFDRPSCQAFHTSFSPGTKVCWHTHGQYSSEIIVCLSGSLSIILETGEERVLNESDFIVIGKEVQHMAIISDKPTEILALTIPKEI